MTGKLKKTIRVNLAKNQKNYRHKYFSVYSNCYLSYNEQSLIKKHCFSGCSVTGNSCNVLRFLLFMFYTKEQTILLTNRVFQVQLSWLYYKTAF